ncbi:hypothetical protein DPMN_041294 [Dreissena polymorpha]|uniref:Uncharacterized protein n=1 Tax=Dreissena polymorpha TaxID=45954 RepID=A0A9D4HVZ0_DREPO|nr:hypothetical protein DPMN_041294 [Dreissena polymorpha]
MAPLAFTGCRLHPRGGFPSALSALGTAAPGSLFKATPSMFMGSLPLRSNPESVLYVLPLVVLLSRRTRPSTDGTSGPVRAGKLSRINSGLVRSASS